MINRINSEFELYVIKTAADYKNTTGTISWVSLIKDLASVFPGENLNYERVRSIYRNSIKQNSKVMPQVKRIEKLGLPVFTQNEDDLEASIGNMHENPANFSDSELADLFNLDLHKWAFASKKINAWNQTQKGPDGQPIQTINYSVQVKFKRVKDAYVDKDVLKEIFDDAKSMYNDIFKPELPMRLKNFEASGNTLVVGVFDAHIGKLSWWKETGENYDLKIASARFLNAVKNVVDKAFIIGVDKVIFPIGNDFFQFDNEVPTTTKDTPVDTDIRWQKLFQKGVALLRTAIDYCANFADVDVIWIPGNHDFKTSFYAFEALRGWYDENAKVTIDENIKTRTYRLIGANLLGFTHGNNEKKTSLHGLMSNEVPELWGQSKYREWIVGHFHKEMLLEDMGVTVRVLGSITGTDAWHYKKGFIGALKAAQGLIFNKNKLGPYIIIYDSIDITKEQEQHQ
jgi:hypothetical protein